MCRSPDTESLLKRKRYVVHRHAAAVFTVKVIKNPYCLSRIFSSFRSPPPVSFSTARTDGRQRRRFRRMPAAPVECGRRKCPGTKFTAPASPIFWRMKIIGYICTPFRTPKRDSETLRCDGRAVRQRSAKPSTAVRFRFAPRRYPAIRRMAGYLSRTFPRQKRETDSNDRDEEVGQDAERGLPPIGTQIRPSFRPDTAKIPKQEGEEPTESGRPSGIWPVRQDSGHASVPAPPNYDGRFAAAACPLHKAASRSSTCTMEASFNITHRSPSSR